MCRYDLQDHLPVTNGEATTEWVWVDPQTFDTSYLTKSSWNEIRYAWSCANVAPAFQKVAMGTHTFVGFRSSSCLPLDDLLDMIIEAGGDPADEAVDEADVEHAVKLLKFMQKLPKRHQTWEGGILLAMTLGALERFYKHMKEVSNV